MTSGIRFQQGNYCYQCGKYETEPAAPACVNPGWHLPNATGQVPTAPPKRRAARLPYAEDR